MVQRAWRALSGNSTAAEVTDQNGFFGTRDARLRAEVNLHIAKLFASQMGLSHGVAPNMGAVRVSNDPLSDNTDFQIVVCISAPCIGKTTGWWWLASRLAQMGYDAIFVHESATDVLESVGGFQQR